MHSSNAVNERNYTELDNAHCVFDRSMSVSPSEERFGHVQGRDADNVTRKVMNLAIPGTRRRGRPKKTLHQQINDDMTCVGVTQDVAQYRNEWRRMTRLTLRR